jgi:hypothetical protein
MTEEELIQRISVLEAILWGISDGLCWMKGSGFQIVDPKGFDSVKPAHKMWHDYCDEYIPLETQAKKVERLTQK